MSSSTAIFWPMIAHIALVYAIYCLLLAGRVKAVKAGSAKVADFRENRQEPPESLLVRNSLSNQFELPPLFFLICIAIYITGHASLYPVLLAWAFVATRCAHAYIHITTNRISHRMPLFVAGLLITLLLLLWLAIGIALN